MFVKPAPAGDSLPGTHLRVLDPDTGQILPPEGLDVPATPYWLRRLADGDVIVPPSSEQTSARPRKAAQE
jgi:hypothetical protein